MGTSQTRSRRSAGAAGAPYGKAVAVALAAMAAFLLLSLLSGCGAGESRAADEGSASASFAAEPGDATVQRAMVAYVNGDDMLFVDVDTQTPYIPTFSAGAVFDAEGNPVGADQLAAGNVVEVTGNGIMLESYPGQYPGITRVEVVEVGTPADAEQYADLVAEVFSASAAEGVPSAVVEYRTELGQVSLNVDPFAYELAVDGGQPKAADGVYADAEGRLSDDMLDAVIDGATQATATFSSKPASAKVLRTALVKSDDAGTRIDPAASLQEVPCTLEEGAVAFSMEPNFVYVVEASFDSGSASYAFMTM